MADWRQVFFMVCAIAAVIALVLVLEGFREGIYQQIRHMVVGRGADVIVAQAGVSNMIASRSLLPQLSRKAVEKIEGVRLAHPLTSLPVIYVKNDRRTPVFILVYDSLGGPNQVVAGHAITGSREIVIDESLAVIYALQPGDDFIVNDFKFSIAGISKDTAAFFAPFAFATYDDLIDLYFESDIVGDLSTLPLLSFLLVEIEPGYEALAIKSAIEERLPEADAYLPQTIADNDVTMSRSMLGPVFQLMIVMAYVICVLVIGLIMYSSVQKRHYELAVFKAIGFPSSTLILGLMLETLLLTMMAFPLAILFSYVLAQLIQHMASVYLILPTRSGPVLHTVVASLSFALLGALMSFRRIGRLEPVMAFRG